MFGFWGFRACLWRSALFFYLPATDRLWLSPWATTLVISPVSLFESNKDSMEVTWGSKSSPPCHRRDQVLFESNNNPSHLKWTCRGKVPSSSCVNFYLNQINCIHPRHDVLTRWANIWKQKTRLRKSQQPNLMRKYINQNPISVNEIGWCLIPMLTDVIEWCILCKLCKLCNLCDLCNVCKSL